MRQSESLAGLAESETGETDRQRERREEIDRATEKQTE